MKQIKSTSQLLVFKSLFIKFIMLIINGLNYCYQKIKKLILFPFFWLSNKIEEKLSNPAYYYDYSLTKETFPFYDRSLLIAVILLVVFGMIMVQSSSVVLVNSPTIIIFKYLIILVGTFVLFFIFPLAIPSKFWEASVILFIASVIILLILVQIIGIERNGAKRWISLGIISLQPAELAKLVIIIYFARFLKFSSNKVQGIFGIKAFVIEVFPFAIVLSALAFLLRLQPDNGTIVSIVLITAATLITCGIKRTLFSAGLIMILIMVLILVFFSSYLSSRLISFLDPFANPYGSGFQSVISLTSFGRGGLEGQGLGNSVSKFHYLTELNTDFIFAIIGEELGIFGILIVIGLYVWIIKRLIHIAFESIFIHQKKFQGYLVLGIIYLFAYQTLYNIGMVTNFLPVDGLTLPLISYGGTSYAVFLLSLSICLRIDSENRQQAYTKLSENLRILQEQRELTNFKNQPNITVTADHCTTSNNRIRIN